MERSGKVLWNLFLAGLFWVVRAEVAGQPVQKAEFVGSTPCQTLVEQFLGIATTNSPYDKITWQIRFHEEQGLPKTYQLVAAYGLQAQSAPGFAEGAVTVELAGSWEILKGTKTNPNAVVFRLKSDKTKKSLSFVKMSENVIHLLDADGNLMQGDDLWSYTLNRKGIGRDD